jgi:hypothetical protein
MIADTPSEIRIGYLSNKSKTRFLLCCIPSKCASATALLLFVTHSNYMFSSLGSLDYGFLAKLNEP